MEQTWRVRVGGDDGEVHGAGVLLDGEHVLTCAHVVENALGGGDPRTASVVVDLPLWPRAGRYTARVVPGGWHPADHEGRGDIAVLRVEDGPVADASGAPLGRAARRGRSVHVFGHPHRHDDGVEAQAWISGLGGRGDWFQLEARSATGRPIEEGFSGGGVVDTASGLVVGIVVARDRDAGARVAWMIPLDVVASYWPPLRDLLERSPYAPAAHEPVPPAPARWDPDIAAPRRLADADPIGLGVHRAISVEPEIGTDPEGGGAGDLPVFVVRDHDRRLRRSLERARSASRMIVLVGGSSTGKTRSAYEGVRDQLGAWDLIHPFTSDELIATLRSRQDHPRTILWLNEGQIYFDGARGEAAAESVRRALTRPGPVVVVTTMWPDYWFAFTRPPAPGAPDPHRQIRELLDLAVRVDVPERFGEQDLAAAARLAGEDARIASALESSAHGHGLTQILAGGLDLIHRWENASNPYGRALITAAIKLRHLGHQDAISPALLRDAGTLELTGPQLAGAPGTWFEDAVAYASQPVKGAIAPLTATAPAVGQTRGYELADYLFYYGRASHRTGPPADALWDVLARHTSQPDDLNRLGAAAANRARYRHAALLWRAALVRGSGETFWSLRRLLLRAGRTGEAEEVLSLAPVVDRTTLPTLIGLLQRAGRPDRARDLLREAADAGDTGAARRLAVLLVQSGRRQEGERELRRAAATGDRDAARLMASLLERTPPPEQTPSEQTPSGETPSDRTPPGGAPSSGRANPGRAARHGHTRAAASAHEMAVFLFRTGREEDAERLLRESAASGDHDAAHLLASLLLRADRRADAETLLRETAGRGDPAAAHRLKAMTPQDTPSTPSEGTSAAGTALGSGGTPTADRVRGPGGTPVADATPRSGDAPGGDAASGSGGDRRAARRRAGGPQKSGRGEQKPSRARMRATELEEAGEIQQAVRVLRDAARQGDMDAARKLALVLRKDGHEDEAVRVLRDAVAHGDADSIQLLEIMLVRLGRNAEARDLVRYGLLADGTTATTW
ncbi:S1 family peptidase [Sphaerisporangium corydalis]|uniref:Trypsin-like peptidase domain-containing protein n=1 Tax=Sphaerisporangium corydalis TaxID=1441875 RepID=A0ABV9EGD6_9ACTN|nr:serine protease [Sphaerisporangium corydalis]